MNPSNIDHPAHSALSQDYTNHVVVMAGTGTHQGQCHLVVASAPNSWQAIASSRHSAGEGFTPTVAFEAKGLLDLLNALNTLELPLGGLRNMTSDANI